MAQNKIYEYEQKIAELQAKLKIERAKEEEKRRKERTRRLIELGAIVNKVSKDIDGGEVDDFERFESWLRHVMTKERDSIILD